MFWCGDAKRDHAKPLFRPLEIFARGAVKVRSDGVDPGLPFFVKGTSSCAFCVGRAKLLPCHEEDGFKIKLFIVILLLYIIYSTLRTGRKTLCRILRRRDHTAAAVFYLLRPVPARWSAEIILLRLVAS